MQNKQAYRKARKIDQELEITSIEKLLVTAYGPEGSVKRERANSRIKDRQTSLVNRIQLRELRESLNLTQQNVANEMHVDHSVVSKFEKHVEKAKLSTLLKYAKALRVNQVNITFEFENGKSGPIFQLTL